MTGWRRYEDVLLSGLWHVHTDRTDGANTPAELVAFADAHRFPLLGVVEHVRREPTYDFEALHAEVGRLAADADLRCAVGCEAKVLDADGTLDADPATLERADLVYAAYHGTRFSRADYLESVRATLANPAVDVWAHPFDYAVRRGFDLEPATYDALLGRAAEHDVLVERNLRRSVRIPDVPARREVRTIVGYDLHDVDAWSTSP